MGHLWVYDGGGAFRNTRCTVVTSHQVHFLTGGGGRGGGTRWVCKLENMYEK